MATLPGLLGPVWERVAMELVSMRPLLPTYVHLLASAVLPIYAAAHASLARPLSARPRPKQFDGDEADQRDEDEPQKIETLTPSDALVFPLLAGAVLTAFYLIITWLKDPAWLNWALGIYFSQLGSFFAVKFLKDAFVILRSFVWPTRYSSAGLLWQADSHAQCYRTDAGTRAASPLPGVLRHLPLPVFLRRAFWTSRDFLYAKATLTFHIHRAVRITSALDVLDLVSVAFTSGIVYYHQFFSKPWFVTNFFGFSFCYGSLQYVTPTTAWTGTLILGALFLYDIYFVFFTPIMVTVATNLDVPIKLLFPRPRGCVYPVGTSDNSALMEEYVQCLAKKRPMAMLGLGDIVVPGMMLAFALRFDLYLYYLRRREARATPDPSATAVEPRRPLYWNARGGWGERFWTSSALWPVDLQAKSFPKPYFYATVAGYLFGMVATVLVMQIAEHAQPALLYLVPGVLSALWGTALVKGDLKTLWSYSEVADGAEAGGERQDGHDKKAAELTALTNEEDMPGEKDASVSKSDDAVDEANGAITAENREDAELKKPMIRKDASKQGGRQLVLFSIVMPDAPQPRSTTNGARESPNASNSTHLEQKSTIPVDTSG